MGGEDHHVSVTDRMVGRPACREAPQCRWRVACTARCWPFARSCRDSKTSPITNIRGESDCQASHYCVFAGVVSLAAVLRG